MKAECSVLLGYFPFWSAPLSSKKSDFLQTIWGILSLLCPLLLYLSFHVIITSVETHKFHKPPLGFRQTHVGDIVHPTIVESKLNYLCRFLYFHVPLLLLYIMTLQVYQARLQVFTIERDLFAELVDSLENHVSSTSSSDCVQIGSLVKTPYVYS